MGCVVNKDPKNEENFHEVKEGTGKSAAANNASDEADPLTGADTTAATNNNNTNATNNQTATTEGDETAREDGEMMPVVPPPGTVPESGNGTTGATPKTESSPAEGAAAEGAPADRANGNSADASAPVKTAAPQPVIVAEPQYTKETGEEGTWQSATPSFTNGEAVPATCTTTITMYQTLPNARNGGESKGFRVLKIPASEALEICPTTFVRVRYKGVEGFVPAKHFSHLNPPVNEKSGHLRKDEYDQQKEREERNIDIEQKKQFAELAARERQLRLCRWLDRKPPVLCASGGRSENPVDTSKLTAKALEDNIRHIWSAKLQAQSGH